MTTNVWLEQVCMFSKHNIVYYKHPPDMLSISLVPIQLTAICKLLNVSWESYIFDTAILEEIYQQICFNLEWKIIKLKNYVRFAIFLSGVMIENIHLKCLPMCYRNYMQCTSGLHTIVLIPINKCPRYLDNSEFIGCILKNIKSDTLNFVSVLYLVIFFQSWFHKTYTWRLITENSYYMNAILICWSRGCP